MANKRIDELTAATPVIGDFVATTGVGGPATKATVKQFHEANLFAVSVAYTGTAPPYFSAIVSAKAGAQTDTALAFSDGVTIETFVYSNGLSTTLTYANLAGIRSTFTMASWASLTSLSFTALAFTGVDFDPNTMNALATLSAPALTYVSGSYGPNQMASLTTLSTPVLAYVGGNYWPSQVASLTTLSAPLLAYVGGSYSPGSYTTPAETAAGYVRAPGVGAITTISTPVLAYVGGSYWQLNTVTSLTTLSTPLLAYVGGNYQPNNIAVLTTLSTPLLAYVGGNYWPSTMAALTTISLPALTSVGVDVARTVYTNGKIAPTIMAALTSFTMPVIEVIGSSSGASISFISGTAALTTFTMGSSLRKANGSVIFTSAALLVASVDGILVRLAALDGTGLTTAYSTKTVTITGTSATPSATGLAAKATLVARGCTVTHN